MIRGDTQEGQMPKCEKLLRSKCQEIQVGEARKGSHDTSPKRDETRRFMNTDTEI